MYLVYIVSKMHVLGGLVLLHRRGPDESFTGKVGSTGAAGVMFVIRCSMWAVSIDCCFKN